MDITVENAFIILKKYLKNTNKEKFDHSIRVAKISKRLAQKWNVSEQDAIIVGLLHDIGKSMTRREMLSLCARNNFTMYDFEIFDNLTALHGKISSLLFEKEFNEDDKERFEAISRAIESHIAGNENMSDLDKIIFIADNIDPKKGENTMLLKIQSGEINTPNECIKKIIEDKKRSARKKGRAYNPLYNSTLSSMDER